jgi:uncharacterized protein
MNIGKTLFAQVMEFIPWSSFSRIVARYRGDVRVRSLSAAEHFRAMALAQLTWRESLRDIEASHWARVRHHALRLCTLRQGDLLVAELFAYLHDSQRENEWTDPLHGARAADYVASLNGSYFELSGEQLDLLTHAARFHSDGLMHQDATIQSCWDADRLDLGRVGITPSKQYLSVYAHALIEKAYEWSIE